MQRAEYSPDMINTKNTFVDVRDVPRVPDLHRCKTEPLRKTDPCCLHLATLQEESEKSEASPTSTPKLPGVLSRSMSRLVCDELPSGESTPLVIESPQRFASTPDSTPLYAKQEATDACAQYLANLSARFEPLQTQPAPMVAQPASQGVVLVPVLTVSSAQNTSPFLMPSAAQNTPPAYLMQPSGAKNPTPPYTMLQTPSFAPDRTPPPVSGYPAEFEEQRQKYLAQWQEEEQKAKWAEWEELGFQRRPRRRRPRRVEPVPPESGCKVFVGGLGPQTTSLTLRAYFSQFGRVLDAAVLADSETKRSRGFGFVDFAGEIPAPVLQTDHVIEQRRCGVRKYEYTPAQTDD